MSASIQSSPAPSVPPASRPVPESARRLPSRWRLFALLAGAGVVAGGLYLILKPSPAQPTGSASLVHTVPVTTGPIERIVRISGQTSARKYATIMVPEFSGPDSGKDLTLMKVAKAGAFVKKGDHVAELDPQSLRDHIDDLADTVQQAENDVAKRRSAQEVEWETLQQNLRVAKADLDKARLDMKAAEVKTSLERELLKLSSDEAEAAYKQLQRDLANKKIADRAELRMMEITAERHKIHRNNHIRDLARFAMRAPMDGLVVMLQMWAGGEMRQIQEGDQVYPGQQFMKIVDPSSMQLEARVSQADSNQFRIGQPATIGLDAFPGAEFRGRIYSIGALAVKGMWETYYIRNVPVLVTIDARDSRLIPDLSAWAHIPVDRREKALVVPAGAVRAEAGGNVVFVRNGRRFDRHPVEVALRTPTLVGLLSGVRPGDRVAVGPIN